MVPVAVAVAVATAVPVAVVVAVHVPVAVTVAVYVNVDVDVVVAVACVSFWLWLLVKNRNASFVMHLFGHTASQLRIAGTGRCETLTRLSTVRCVCVQWPSVSVCVHEFMYWGAYLCVQTYVRAPS